MKINKYFFTAILSFTMFLNTKAQIKNMNDFIVKTEELRMLTQRIAKNYIMKGILPNNEKIAKKLDGDIQNFSDILINLTDNAEDEEISIELQKLNLSWLLMNRILQKKYDGTAAAKVIKYARKMSDEIETIADMISDLAKMKSVKILRVSSYGRMLSQELLLYYIAGKAKVRNAEIPNFFKETKSKLSDVIKLLSDQSENDPDLKTDSGILMYIDMIKDGYDKVRKNITLNSKVHPTTANMIVSQMTDNFELLTNMIYERFN